MPRLLDELRAPQRRMKPITPREVVVILDRMFQEAPRNQQEAWERKNSATPFMLHAPDFGPSVAALYELLESIPSTLITHRPEEFFAAKAVIRHTLGVWEQKRDVPLGNIRGFDPLNAVTLIRRSLNECPDSVPSEKTPLLTFLQDTTLQENLRLDMSSAFESAAAHQWKAACVLAASVIEALLHWALKDRDAEARAAEASIKKRLAATGGFTLPADRTRWTLNHYTEVALELRVIGDTVAAKCRLAKDARNLIHPGAEERRKAICNRSEALSALAALAAVVDQLSEGGSCD